jgi:hypothetical protein
MARRRTGGRTSRSTQHQTWNTITEIARAIAAIGAAIAAIAGSIRAIFW